MPKALTPEEKALFVVRSFDITVKAGFFDRVATYVKNQEQLLAVFKVIQPTVNSADFKNGLQDTKPKKARQQDRRH